MNAENNSSKEIKTAKKQEHELERYFICGNIFQRRHTLWKSE
ncbi:MAG: hypothetical protein ABH865_06470 [Candidatus Omnitrophota bacterium]